MTCPFIIIFSACTAIVFEVYNSNLCLRSTNAFMCGCVLKREVFNTCTLTYTPGVLNFTLELGFCVGLHRMYFDIGRDLVRKWLTFVEQFCPAHYTTHEIHPCCSTFGTF